MVELQPSKLGVAGSNPVSRSSVAIDRPRSSVVEHFLGKEEVTGSIPVMGSSGTLKRLPVNGGRLSVKEIK